MPLNFGIKVVLFQNYHVCIPDRSTVMGRESWSGVYCLSSPMSTHEPMLQNFLRECHCYMGTWIHLSRPAINAYPTLARATQQFSHALFPSTLSSASTSARPPMVCPFVMKTFERLEEFLCIGWLRYLSQRLVEQEDQSLRLEEFLWYHLSLLFMLAKLFLVFARARICNHLPLVTPPNTHRESLRLLSHNSSIY